MKKGKPIANSLVHCEVLPPKKGGAKKVLAMLKGGTTSFEVVLTQDLEVLAILNGGAKSVHSIKRGRKKFYPVFSS